MKIFKALGTSPVVAAILFLIGCIVIATNNGEAQIWRWSQTAGNNGTADPNINFATGMAPSAVSPSARAMMAALAEARDDWSGANATGGTASAYTLSSNQGFDSLAHLNNQKLCFTPNNTNAAGATLAVDGLPAEPIDTAPSTAVGAGVLVQGTPYCVLFSNSNLAYYLVDFTGNPFNVPLGVMLDYAGTSAPNSNFALAYGQCISRTTYAALFSLVSTAFSSCDGVSTFGLPDTRGRVIAGLDNLGGTPANRLTSATGCTMTSVGGSCGAQSQTLAANNIPQLSTSYTPAGTVGLSTSQQWGSGSPSNFGLIQQSAVGAQPLQAPSATLTFSGTAATITVGTPSPNAATTVQPTLGLSKIIRIF